MHDPNVTIVTAFVDIGRSEWNNGPPYLKRDNESYFQSFERLLKLKNPIIVFTQPKFSDRMDKYSNEHENLKVIYLEDWSLGYSENLGNLIKLVHSNPEFLKDIKQPWNPEYWSSDYVMVNFLKSFYVTKAIRNGLVNTNMIAWIDFGYARNDECVPTDVWNHNLNESKIHLFSIEKEIPNRIDLMDVINNNKVYIQGCHIVMNVENWKLFNFSMFDIFRDLLSQGVVDDDQTLLLLFYLRYPDMCKVHYVDPSDWFVIFKNYNNAKSSQ